MKTNNILTRGGISCFVLSLLLIVVELDGQDKATVSTAASNSGAQGIPSGNAGKTAVASTEADQPGLFHKEFGMLPDSKLAKTLRPLSKIDMDGDLNYDGLISNDSSNGPAINETRPPGLQIGVGELSKLIIRFKTYEEDFPGDLYVTLAVDGINRFSPTGEFASDDQEKSSTGRIRVWRDIKQKELLLDSDDPKKRTFEWKVDKAVFKTGLPGNIPRTVFVEGVEASNLFEGDLRLLISSSQTLSTSEPREPSSHYKTAFDHMVLTVREKPVKKELINEASVWSKAKQSQ